MKKFSKILVILMTLAMLLGVVVITASADGNAVDYVNSANGTVVGYATLKEAIDAANLDTVKGDVTISLNSAQTLAEAVTITRNAEEHGKVIIKLNGNTLTLNATGRYDDWARVTGTGVMEPTVFVKASETAAPVEYFMSSKNGGNLIVTAANGTPYTLVAGETYVGTVSVSTSGKDANTTNIVKKGAGSTAAYLHQITVGNGANLTVEGSGTVSGAAGADMFAIDQGTDADLTVKNVTISKSKGSGHESIADIQGGRATFDGIYVNPYNIGSAFWQGDNGEITIKNSLIIAKNTNNDYSLIHTETTNTAKAADGYHIEVYNSTIIAHANLIGGGTYSTNSGPNANDGSANGTRHFDENSVRIKGITYYNTSALFENCNIEVVNYDNTAATAHQRQSTLAYGARCDVDFSKSNIFVAQRAFGHDGSASNATYNFKDCYVEFTGKGNLSGVTQFALDSRTIKLYNTEVRLGANYAAGKNPDGTDITATTFYNGVTYFGAGCVLDVALDDTLLAKIPAGAETYTDKGVMLIGSITEVYDFFSNDGVTAGGVYSNPLVILGSTRKDLKNNCTGAGWNYTTTQGHYVLVEEADGNKYVAFDSSYVYNVMTESDLIALTADEITALGVAGATGAWNIDDDADWEYLNTDSNNADAEWVNIGAAGTYNWVEIPEKYEYMYQASNTIYIANASYDLAANDYAYITYSFDLKNAEGTDVFYPFSVGVQGRNAGNGSVAATNSTPQRISVSPEGILSVGSNSVQLNFDEWNTVDVIVEVVEKEVEAGKGYVTDKNVRTNISYADTLVHVFANGELVGSYVWSDTMADANCHNLVVGLRGNDWVEIVDGRETLVGDALAKGAMLCFDNVTRAAFHKRYNDADLKAILAGEKDIETWDHYSKKLGELAPETVPAKLTADNAAASVTLPAPRIDSNAWSTTNKVLQNVDDGAYASVFYTATVEDAVRLGAYSTVNLIDNAEGVIEVNSNTTVKTNGKNFKWTSSAFYNSSDVAGTLAFVPAGADNLAIVKWVSANSSEIFGAQVYGKGSTLVPLGGANIGVDAFSFYKYIYNDADAINVTVTDDMEVEAYKLVPNFRVSDSLVLESNLVHKIRIYKLVDGIDILDKITKISLGGTVYYDKAASVNNLETGVTADGAEYYYISTGVKSNEIAKGYDLEIDFTNNEGIEISASQTFSIVNYLTRAFATTEEDSALYNLLASVVKYGAAAYANFESNADEKAIVDALAEEYAIDVTVPTVAAGAAGSHIDVEFSLNETVEYRFYIVGIDADKMYASNVTLGYTNYLGEEITVDAMRIKQSGDRYYVELDLPAYEICGNVTVSLLNTEAGVNDTVTYSIANYYADAKAAGSDAELLALVEGLYAYASSAKAYVESKLAQ